MRFLKRYTPEISGAIFCLGLGLLSGYATQSGLTDWYVNLAKPSFNPPSWVFGPVWSLLYIMMGVALGKLWKNRRANHTAILVFILQLIFNLAWSVLFFYCQRIDLALYDIGLLWMSLLTLLVLVVKQRTVFLLLVPYFLWVSFAMFLNLSIYHLNM